MSTKVRHKSIKKSLFSSVRPTEVPVFIVVDMPLSVDQTFFN
jgi:hypothetical protein